MPLCLHQALPVLLHEPQDREDQEASPVVFPNDLAQDHEAQGERDAPVNETSPDGAHPTSA